MHFNLTPESILLATLHNTIQTLPRITKYGHTGYGSLIAVSTTTFLGRNDKMKPRNDAIACTNKHERAVNADVDEQVRNVDLPTPISCFNTSLFNQDITANATDTTWSPTLDISLNHSADFFGSTSRGHEGLREISFLSSTKSVVHTATTRSSEAYSVRKSTQLNDYQHLSFSWTVVLPFISTFPTLDCVRFLSPVLK